MLPPPPRSTLFPYTTLFRSETKLERFPLRWYGVEEFKMILEKVGFEDIVIAADYKRSEEHTSELQSRFDLVCRLLLEKKKQESVREKLQQDRDKSEMGA